MAQKSPPRNPVRENIAAIPLPPVAPNNQQMSRPASPPEAASGVNT